MVSASITRLKPIKRSDDTKSTVQFTHIPLPFTAHHIMSNDSHKTLLYTIFCEAGQKVVSTPERDLDSLKFATQKLSACWVSFSL